jgi:hypothetical protein
MTTAAAVVPDFVGQPMSWGQIGEWGLSTGVLSRSVDKLAALLSSSAAPATEYTEANAEQIRNAGVSV